MRKWFVVMAVIALLLAGGAERSSAQFLGLIDWTKGVQAIPYSSQTFGWSFTLSHGVAVTHLGVWDYNGGTRTNDHLVRLWKADQTLVASGTVLSTTVSTLGSGGNYWAWVQLSSPVWLSPGTYVIGADYIIGDATMRVDYLASNASLGPYVSYVTARQRLGAYGFPDTESDTLKQGFFGPNFQYVPEPALLQLPFLLGLGGAGLWWRRRRTA